MTTQWAPDDLITASRSNSKALDRATGMAALALIDDTNFGAQAAIADIFYQSRGNGLWRWVSGTSPAVGEGVIASYAGNRWVREPLMSIGGRMLLVDPGHQYAQASGTVKGLPFATPALAEAVMTDGDIIRIAPGTYSGALLHSGSDLSKSGAWIGDGPVKLANNGTNATARQTITATGKTLRFDNIHFEIDATPTDSSVEAMRVTTAAGKATLLYNNCKFTATDTINGTGLYFSVTNAAGSFDAVLNDCVFESGLIFSGSSAASGNITFNRCKFTSLSQSLPNHTIVLNDCQVENGWTQPSGTIEVNGGYLAQTGTSFTILTSDNNKTLTMKCSNVDFRCNNSSGLYMDEGVTSSTFNLTLINCTTTGTAKRLGSGVSVTYAENKGEIYTVQVALNGSTALTTSDKAYFRIPNHMDYARLIGVAAMCQTASTSGTPTFTVKKASGGGSFTTMLTTNITIDANEYDTLTAATPAVIDTTADQVNDGTQIEVACSVAGTGTKWVVVELRFRGR